MIFDENYVPKEREIEIVETTEEWELTDKVITRWRPDKEETNKKFYAKKDVLKNNVPGDELAR